MLEMKDTCLTCNVTLHHYSDAMICSYECTYCVSCATQHHHICNNCGGDLQQRPKRPAKHQT